MRENRLREIGHISKREITEAVKVVKRIYIEGKKGIGSILN